MTTTVERWEKIANDQLKGRKIVECRYLSDEEMENLGWYRKAVVIQLDDGNLIWPSADDEGNNAGALFTNNEQQPVLPVI